MLTDDICRGMIVSSGDITAYDIIFPKHTERGERIMKKRLLITTAALAAAVFAVYQISIITGGAFHDFCKSAVSWVLLGTGTASAMAYSSTDEQTEKGR